MYVNELIGSQTKSFTPKHTETFLSEGDVNVAACSL